jgi:NACHT domain
MDAIQLDRQSTLTKLQRMSEKALRQRILLPLLGKYDFTHIEERHGPHEKGTDILCLRYDELGDLDIVVIQAKRLPYSGAATNKGHLHGLLNQLSQCIREPLKLPDGTERLPNRIWFVSPFPLDISALESSFAALSAAPASRIKIIDGPKLMSVLQLKAPELLAQLGDRYALYLKRIQDELILLQEASAFRLREKMSVLPFYVQLDLSLLSERITNSASVTRSARPELAASMATLRAKISTFKSTTDSATKAASLGEIHVATNRTLEMLTDKQTSIAVEQVDDSFSVEVGDTRLDVDAETLLRSRLNFQVVGLAGGGKTTLLRMLGYREAAARTGRLPIFVSLAATDAKTSILSRIKDSCGQHGLPTSKQSIHELLDTGKALLLLDGVDEALAGRASLHQEILQLVQQYNRTQFVFSARGWAALPPNPSFCTAKLLPFTPDQVRQFLTKWFGEQPKLADEIIRHLDGNPELYPLISTPLVATIFAVVKALGGTLPSSLMELYEERLRLLLHDWDAARGIKRDQFRVQDKRFFLRKLAFELHKAGARSLPWRNVLSLVRGTIGEIKTQADAEAFALELVNHNNILLKDSKGDWGLGHLQYQEHLAALEARENPAVNLAPQILEGWWAGVIAMYAEMTRDVATLIKKAYKGHEGEGFSDQPQMLAALRKLIQLAPNTDVSARVQVDKDWEIHLAVRKSFDRVPESEPIWDEI